jgi:hypothetical protein
LPKKSLISLLVSLHLLGLGVAQAGDISRKPVPEEPKKTSPETAPVLAPSGITDVYSDIDMRLRLAIKPDAVPCVAEGCEFNQAFDARVQQLGAQLATSAFVVYPALKDNVKQFSFSVVDKKNPGTASNGAGKVVLFRGVQQLELSDDVLSFVIAREMGHVISDHHTTNTYTKLIISLVASVAFPALAVVGASSAAAQATTATTLLTSAATTATSVVGSEVALAQMKPEQLDEADEIALNLMNHQGWDLHSAASVLQFDDALNTTNAKNGWLQDLQVSQARLQKMTDEETLAIMPLEDEYIVADAVSMETESAVEVAPVIETAPIQEAPTAKIGFEDYDPSKDSETAEQDLPVAEIAIEADATALEPKAETNADVIVEAIETQ